MLEQMKEAVKDAKKRVYDKAQAQFANGNKEYNKLKSQYKDVASVKNTLKKELESSKEQIAQLNNEIITHKQSITNDKKLMKEYANLCELTIKHFRGNSSCASLSNNQSDSEKLELAKASIGIQFKQFNELKSQLEDLRKKLRDNDLSCEMKDGQIEKLKIQISNQEKLVEKNEKDMIDMESKMNEMQTQADAQNNVIAKLMLDNSSTDKCDSDKNFHADSLSGASSSIVPCTKCNELKKSNLELEERCISLRAMNEEVMGMLESMNGVTQAS